MVAEETVQPKKVVAVFIAYNAAKTLEDFYRDFPRELVDEVILVDDCSTDNTFELARRLGITSYQNPVNLGYGGNLKRAIALALERGANVIVDIHPDGEYKPSAIGPALQKVEEGAALVLGMRYQRIGDLSKHGMRFWKLPPLLIMGIIHRFVLGTRIRDLHQGFRVYTRKLLQTVYFENTSNNYLLSFELIAQTLLNKLPIAEVPVETSYTGKKRGASLRASVVYSLGTFGILLKFVLAKLGWPVRPFQPPVASLTERIRLLAHPKQP